MRKVAAFLLVLGLASMCGLEAYFRLTAHLDAIVYRDSADPILRFELRPGAEGVKAGAWVKINADGLRERDLPRAKPAGEYRVVVVGDEPAFGLGVAEEETFVRRLEGLLRPPPGSHLITINLAMYHYDLRQELELLRTKGLAYQPDVIVFETAVDKPQLPKVRYDFPRLKNMLRERSVFLRWLMEGSYWSRPPVLSAQASGAVRNSVDLLAKLVKESEIPTILVMFPDMRWEGPREAAESRDLQAYRRAGAAAGLPCYDVSQALGPGPWKRYRIRDEAWPNAAAESAAAAGMAPAIQRLIGRGKSARNRLLPATPKL